MPQPTPEEIEELEPGLYTETSGDDVLVFGKTPDGVPFCFPLSAEDSERFSHELIVKAFLVRNGRG
jgi:hypothetical protein